MIHLADTIIPLRQVLAFGRVTDRITGRGVDPFTARLTYSVAGISKDLPSTVRYAPDGWFAFHQAADRLPADLTGVGFVTLTLRVTAPGRGPVEQNRSVPRSTFFLVRRPLESSGTHTEDLGFTSSPVDFSVDVAPAPVGLRGIVLIDYDPDHPVVGATVAVDGGPFIETGADGRFRLASLPVLQSIVIVVTVEGEDHAFGIRPDYSRPVNTATLSLPG